MHIGLSLFLLFLNLLVKITVFLSMSPISSHFLTTQFFALSPLHHLQEEHYIAKRFQISIYKLVYHVKSIQFCILFPTEFPSVQTDTSRKCKSLGLKRSPFHRDFISIFFSKEIHFFRTKRFHFVVELIVSSLKYPTQWERRSHSPLCENSSRSPLCENSIGPFLY